MKGVAGAGITALNRTQEAAVRKGGGEGMGKFLKGVFIGCAIAFSAAVLVAAFRFFQERDRKIYEYIKQEAASK